MATGKESGAPPEGGQGGIVNEGRITIRGRQRLEQRLSQLVPYLGYLPSWREVITAPLVALDTEYLDKLKKALGAERITIAAALRIAVEVAKEALKEERYKELAKGV